MVFDLMVECFPLSASLPLAADVVVAAVVAAAGRQWRPLPICVVAVCERPDAVVDWYRSSGANGIVVSRGGMMISVGSMSPPVAPLVRWLGVPVGPLGSCLVHCSS